eukprot:1155633-Pelagomonas_calceolata.AAC.2
MAPSSRVQSASRPAAVIQVCRKCRQLKRRTARREHCGCHCGTSIVLKQEWPRLAHVDGAALCAETRTFSILHPCAWMYCACSWSLFIDALHLLGDAAAQMCFWTQHIDALHLLIDAQRKLMSWSL